MCGYIEINQNSNYAKRIKQIYIHIQMKKKKWSGKSWIQLNVKIRGTVNQVHILPNDVMKIKYICKWPTSSGLNF